jgi:hypothetical protein
MWGDADERLWMGDSMFTTNHESVQRASFKRPTPTRRKHAHWGRSPTADSGGHWWLFWVRASTVASSR